MTLATVNVNFVRTQGGQNPQDFVKYPLIISTASAGDVNVIHQLNSTDDIAQYGDGPLTELCYAAALKASYPLFALRCPTSAVGTIGSITKTFSPTAVGTPLTFFGAVVIAGAANGDVLINQKQLGATIAVINPGVLTASTTVNVVGSVVTVTLKHDGTNITETGTGLAAAINGSAPAFALLSATAIGTGAGVVGALASTLLDDGAFKITALQSGVSAELIISGNNTVFNTAYNVGLKKITITMGTNAIGEPNTTAFNILNAVNGLAALALANPGVFTSALVTTGLKTSVAKANTTLAFGSTGSMTAANNPTNKYAIKVVVARGGTVGVATDMTIRWTADSSRDESLFGEVIVPLSGVVALSNPVLNTGVSITLSGQLEAGDYFTFLTTEPTVNTTDFLSAMDVAVADSFYKFGYVCSDREFSRSEIVLIDNKLQPVLATKFLQGMFCARQLNPGETVSQYETAIATDFAGQISFRGAVDVATTPIKWLSPKTNMSYKSAGMHALVGRRSSVDMHQDMGQIEDGALPGNVLEIYLDEFKHPFLGQQRFICLRTIPGVQNQFYVGSDVTRADVTDVDYGEIRLNDVTFTAARVAYEVGFSLLNKTFETIPIRESATVPAGALTKSAASYIQQVIVAPLRAILQKIKPNTRQPSVNNIPDSQLVIVKRDYSFSATSELRIDIAVSPLGVAQNIYMSIIVKR